MQNERLIRDAPSRNSTVRNPLRRRWDQSDSLPLQELESFFEGTNGLSLYPYGPADHTILVVTLHNDITAHLDFDRKPVEDEDDDDETSERQLVTNRLPPNISAESLTKLLGPPGRRVR